MFCKALLDDELCRVTDREAVCVCMRRAPSHLTPGVNEGQLYPSTTYNKKPPTLVNFEHMSSASLTRPAFSMYLAHLELMKRSAVSSAWASSIHRAASLTFPACCTATTPQSQPRSIDWLGGVPLSVPWHAGTRYRPCRSWP